MSPLHSWPTNRLPLRNRLAVLLVQTLLLSQSQQRTAANNAANGGEDCAPSTLPPNTHTCTHTHTHTHPSVNYSVKYTNKKLMVHCFCFPTIKNKLKKTLHFALGIINHFIPVQNENTTHPSLFVDLQGVFSLWSLLYGSVLHAFLGGEYIGTSCLHTCLSVCTSVHAQQARTCIHMIIPYRHTCLHVHTYT